MQKQNPSTANRIILCALTGFLMIIQLLSAELDSNGCRILSKLPKPGVHPRVFFMADEYPRMRERLNAPGFKAKFDKIRKQVVSIVKREWAPFAEADMSNPTDEQILKYFTTGEGRNQQWGIASLTAILNDDKELLELMKKVITNYAHIILASKKRSVGGDLKGRTGTELNKRLNIWKKLSFDVGVSWTFGSAGYAVSYDVLYNHMSEVQRSTVRKAIATATMGRKSYGNGMPRGYAVSNHYGYHGDLAVLMAAIEGEEGFDQKTWDGIEQVLRDFWEVGFTRMGASHEDGYGPNLGLRAGTRGYMVLARRGYNIFSTEKFRKFLNYFAWEYEPFPGGLFNGGASGGPYDQLYPTSTLISRYMYPDNVSANYIYRYLIGDEYERQFRWQGWLDFFLYGTDWKGPPAREEMLKNSGLSLSVYYPERGKFIARSDWSTDAMYATLDARPDAHSIGHDKVDRGNFSMSALGRFWAFAGDFAKWNLSTENSLVHIDGKAQAWKAPSVRFLWQEQEDAIAGAAADLKYAYDWEWSPPWKHMNHKFPAPWEREMNGPLDLGWPKKVVVPELCPKSLNASETGYADTNNLHKRPYNVVQKAKRSLFLIRGKHPYLIICDDIRKDDKPHLYEWYMQLPTDLKAKSNQGNEVILSEETGGREMLVRFLQDAKCETKLETYEAAKDRRRGTITNGQRLIASTNSVEPKFQTMLFPYRVGQSLPKTTWSDDRTTLTIAFPDHTDFLTFNTTEKEGTKVSLDKRSAK